MAHGERCVLCARWRETTVGPLRESIETPLDCRSIFSPAVWSESIRGVRLRFLCAAPVAKAMSSQKFSGLGAWVCRPLFSMFKAFDSPSLAARYIACGAFGAVLAYVLAAAYVPVLVQRAIADGGWFLSPQSVELSEAGVLQRVKGGSMQWEWSAFMAREESSTMHYLFIEPGQCVLLPKDALPPEAHALVRRHVPVTPAEGKAAPANRDAGPPTEP